MHCESCLNSHLSVGVGATKLCEDLQDAIEVGEPRSEAIDKLIEHVLTLDQVILAVSDLISQLVEELSLDAAEGLGRLTARASELRICVLPLLQLIGSLLVGCNLMLYQLLQQSILLLLAGNELTKQIDRRAIIRRLIRFAFRRYVDPKHGGNGLVFVRHYRELPASTCMKPLMDTLSITKDFFDCPRIAVHHGFLSGPQKNFPIIRRFLLASAVWVIRAVTTKVDTIGRPKTVDAVWSRWAAEGHPFVSRSHSPPNRTLIRRRLPASIRTGRVLLA